MKEKIKSILQKPFVRNVIILSSGTAAAQIIAVALSPIITRLYGPEAFGLMGVFMAIINIIVPIAALTYPVAIVLPKDDSDAKGLVRLSLYIAFCFAFLAAAFLLLFGDLLVSLFNIGEIAPYLLLIPLVIIFAGLMQVGEQWLIRTKQFKINAKTTLLQSVINNGSKVGIGMFYPYASALILISAANNGIKALLIYLFIKKSNYRTHVTKNSMRELAKKHKDFPIYRAPQELINGISQNIPVILLSVFFGPASAGFFTLGRTVLSAPIKLISKSVGDVFYPRISDADKNKENISLLIKKATLSLILIGIVPFGLIILLGPWIFSFVFGSEWYTAGEYARWIGLWVFFMFINQPSVRTLPVLNAQNFHLKYSTFTIVVRTGALIVGYLLFLDDLIAIAAFGVTASILNIGLIWMTINISKKHDLKRGIE